MLFEEPLIVLIREVLHDMRILGARGFRQRFLPGRVGLPGIVCQWLTGDGAYGLSTRITFMLRKHGWIRERKRNEDSHADDHGECGNREFHGLYSFRVLQAAGLQKASRDLLGECESEGPGRLMQSGDLACRSSGTIAQHAPQA